MINDVSEFTSMLRHGSFQTNKCLWKFPSVSKNKLRSTPSWKKYKQTVYIHKPAGASNQLIVFNDLLSKQMDK